MKAANPGKFLRALLLLSTLFFLTLAQAEEPNNNGTTGNGSTTGGGNTAGSGTSGTPDKKGIDSTGTLSSSPLQSGNYVNDVVQMTFYLPSGNLSTFTCPTSATSSTPIEYSTTTAIYDQNLTSHNVYAGYSCNIIVSHYANQTLAAYLASIGVSTTAPGGACPTELYGAPTNMYCYQGALSSINTYNANTSVCYNDFSSSTGCAGIPLVGTSPTQYVGVYYAYNSVVDSSTILSNGTVDIPVPSCSSGSPLLLNLPSNTNFGFTYTRSVTYEQSSDGAQSLPGICTCNAHTSAAGNSPSNSSCTAASLSINSGYKNQITVAANSPSYFLTASSTTPYAWLSAAACTIGAVVQSTPISP